ncbi:MAG TPA: Asr1405/Asl0597 family protein [Stenomitos sp.]
MLPPSSSNTSVGQIVDVSRILRWQIYHRLQELRIPCWCPADGSLRVEVNDSVSAMLVRSTVQQFVAPRQELVDWLERCWQI